MKSPALAKLAKAARLSAEASRLYAEAAEELEAAERAPDTVQPIPQLDRARADRAIRRIGATRR